MLFKDLMAKNRWNYTTLAKELGVSRLTIANWDSGVTSPSLFYADQLCKLLGIDVTEIFKRAEQLKERNNGLQQ